MPEKMEQKARDMGWRPLEEFKGQEDRWVDAETFVERGETIMPILKERLGKMETTLNSLRDENVKVTGSLHKLADWHRGTWKRQYNKALQTIQDDKRAAVSEADNDRYAALEEQERNLIQEAAEEHPDELSEGGQTIPEYTEFQLKNEWYGSDHEMTMYANGLQAILVQHEGFTDNETFFQEIEKRVRSRFPEKFRNDNQALPPAVEGSGGEGVGAGVGDKRVWGDIPREHQAAYNLNFTDIMTKEDYAKEYWLQEGV
jgi:hypothetical protein